MPYMPAGGGGMPAEEERHQGELSFHGRGQEAQGRRARSGGENIGAGGMEVPPSWGRSPMGGMWKPGMGPGGAIMGPACCGPAEKSVCGRVAASSLCIARRCAAKRRSAGVPCRSPLVSFL